MDRINLYILPVLSILFSLSDQPRNFLALVLVEKGGDARCCIFTHSLNAGGSRNRNMHARVFVFP